MPKYEVHGTIQVGPNQTVTRWKINAEAQTAEIAKTVIIQRIESQYNQAGLPVKMEVTEVIEIKPAGKEGE